MFTFMMDSRNDMISWQEKEVAWGTFVGYAVAQQAAQLGIDHSKSRMIRQRSLFQKTL